jgi:hypothetical protein
MDTNILGNLISGARPLIYEMKRNIVYRIFKTETAEYVPYYMYDE